MTYYKMDGLSIIGASNYFNNRIVTFYIGLDLIFIYIFKTYLFRCKRYLNIYISFSKTWAITFLSGMTSFIITLIFFLQYFSYSIALTTLTLEIFTATSFQFL